MAKRIRAVFQDGKATITTSGFAGKACTDATRALEQALGVVTADTPTAEMRQAATVEAARTVEN